ncbi:MAG: SAM-dependent chlorinase/fluorinase [Bryobacterales bacterium]|nr:SAM-dependent chlorinase/fluorinase [Bryobacterales bacterium]
MPPILTLTTDFGLQDHFVAAMKGVVLTIAPTAQIIDITHQITPFDINEAAFTLAEAWRYFPKKTVHVVVVDPGVGSTRRPILAQAGGQSFIAPDNGVLSLIYEQEPKTKVRHITAGKYMRDEVSQTFHGRDIFAPAAAHLAKGTAVASFGKLIEDPVKLPGIRPHRSGRRAWSGTILKIDRFGNLITNFSRTEFPTLTSMKFSLTAGLEQIIWLRSSYAEAPFGEPFAIWGSSGYLEVSLNQGNAAKQLGVGVGAPAELELIG